MNVVATSLWDVYIFTTALSERRARHGLQALPWLQGVRTYGGEINLAVE